MVKVGRQNHPHNQSILHSVQSLMKTPVKNVHDYIGRSWICGSVVELRGYHGIISQVHFFLHYFEPLFYSWRQSSS